MKIYNYGNDYAFQRKQQSKESVQTSKVIEPATMKPKEKGKNHVKDKVQTTGKGSMANAAQNDISKQAKEADKKKKENTIDSGQTQEESQVL